MLFSDSSDSICVYGAGVLLKHLDGLEKEIDGVREEPEDIENIHKARVASRRLRSAFDLFKDCLPHKKRKAWLKEIKNVTHALGAARDLDVQLDVLKGFISGITEPKFFPGLNRLRLRLEQRRSGVQPDVESAMKSLVESQTIEEMTDRLKPDADRRDDVYLYSPSLYQLGFDSISQRLDELLSYESIIDQPEKKEELHAMRIAAKHLRYTMEHLSALYENELKKEINTIRKAQDLLGEIHDCDVWIDFLPRFHTEEKQRTITYFGSARAYYRLAPGIAYFLKNREIERQKKYNEFLTGWQGWKEEGIWQGLRKRIQAPFYKNAPAPQEEEPTQSEAGTPA